MPSDREVIEDLSRRYGLSINLIVALVRAELIAEIDPIEPTGEVFLFQSQRDRHEAFGDRAGDFNFYSFNTSIPEPDDNVDLLVALKEFNRDIEHMRRLIAPEHVISGQPQPNSWG